MMWLISVSDQIEKYLNRSLLIEARTEYYDAKYQKDEFFIKGAPVTTLTSVYIDSSGLWDGSESELSNPYIGADSRSIVLANMLNWTARKGIRIIYTGGMAYHPVNSIFVVTNSNTPTVGNYMKGGTSGAIGIVSAWDNSTKKLTIENYYGKFEVGETLTEYTDEGETETTPAVTATLDSVDRWSLAEAYPPIASAAEMQCRYYWVHSTDFENTGSMKDGTTTRQRQDRRVLPLLPEVMNLLAPYRRMILS